MDASNSDGPPPYEVVMGLVNGKSGVVAPVENLPNTLVSHSFHPIVGPCDETTTVPSGTLYFNPVAGHIPHVPSGLPVLDQAFASLPSVVHVKDTEDKYQREFYIRDVFDSLIFKADIGKLDGEDENEIRSIYFTHVIIVENSFSGNTLLNIYCAPVAEQAMSRYFELVHQGTKLGGISLLVRDQIESVKISNIFESRDYFASFVTDMDLMVVSGHENARNPIAKIHIELIESGYINHGHDDHRDLTSLPSWISFKGTVAFCDPSLTTVDRSLILSLAMAIMKVKKDKYNKKHSGTSFYSYCCCIPTVIIIFVLCFFVAVKL